MRCRIFRDVRKIHNIGPLGHLLKPRRLWPPLGVFVADTALRLGRFFGMESRFWLNLQAQYDMEVAEAALGDRLEVEVHPFGRAAPE